VIVKILDVADCTDAVGDAASKEVELVILVEIEGVVVRGDDVWEEYFEAVDTVWKIVEVAIATVDKEG
jgi:hypothetical protein